MRGQEVGAEKPAKRFGARWLVGFGIVGVLFWVGIGVVLFVAYRSDQRTRAALDMAGNAWVDAMTSPYKSELRALRKAGCERANLIDYPSLEGQPSQRVLTCQASLLGAPPKCRDVARSYLAKMPRTEALLTVLVQHRLSQTCLEVFSPDGDLLHSETKD